MTIKFPKQPSDPYYFQCCGVGHIHINSWLNKKPKYKDQKGTYYFTHDELLTTDYKNIDFINFLMIQL